jgi:transglutaminase-like putative cysteine protease
MLIKIGFDVTFELPAPTPFLLNLSVHPSRFHTLQGLEQFRVEPHVPLWYYTDAFGNTCSRLVAPAGAFRLVNEAVVLDSGLPDPINPLAPQHPVELLPPETLQFLLASRFCEVDLLKEVAWGLFCGAPPGMQRVIAVCNWVHANITFGYAHARPTKSASETYAERRGVCRDFAHLAITFCRALNIPARYATGYLGDIGVPISPAPMDFSGWFEVYLGGQWWTMDARHNTPRIGRVLMATGRDATDVALTTAFGTANLKSFKVVTEEVPS